MKKYLLTLLAITITGLCFGQSKLDSAINLYNHNTDGKVIFDNVMASSLPIADRFRNAKKWIATNYKDYKSVIQIEENGLIIYKGVSIYSNGGNMPIKFKYTTEISFKESKTRVRISNINEVWDSTLVPIESALSAQKARKDKNREYGSLPVLGEYKMFTDLASELSKAIINNEEF